MNTLNSYCSPAMACTPTLQMMKLRHRGFSSHYEVPQLGSVALTVVGLEENSLGIGPGGMGVREAVQAALLHILFGTFIHTPGRRPDVL